MATVIGFLLSGIPSPNPEPLTPSLIPEVEEDVGAVLGHLALDDGLTVGVDDDEGEGDARLLHLRGLARTGLPLGVALH